MRSPSKHRTCTETAGPHPSRSLCTRQKIVHIHQSIFAVSIKKQVYCILNNWCICINLSCGQRPQRRTPAGLRFGVQGCGVWGCCLYHETIINQNSIIRLTITIIIKHHILKHHILALPIGALSWGSAYTKPQEIIIITTIINMIINYNIFVLLLS